MARSSTIPMSFPPFAGVVRKLVLANVAVFFAMLLLGWLAPGLAGTLLGNLLLQPAAVSRGEIWQLGTYCFIHLGLLEILFAMLTLWFCGSLLEGAYGGRWLKELYFTSAIGGAVVASVISFTHLLGLSPESVPWGVGGDLRGDGCDCAAHGRHGVPAVPVPVPHSRQVHGGDLYIDCGCDPAEGRE